MKKKLVTALLISALSVSVFAGCGPVDREAQESYRQLGITQLQSGEYSSAVESFQKALNESLGKIGKREMDICYYKALAQFKAGQTLGAIETYMALLEYDDENADAYFLRGSAYLQCEAQESVAEKQSEYHEKGMADYDKAISLDAKNYKLYIGIYENLMALDWEDEADAYLAKALELACETGQEYCSKGYVYLMLGEYDQAASLLATAVEKNCDEAILYQAQLYKLQGDEEKAQSLLDAYIAKYPEDVNALSEAGMLAFSAGAYEEAAKILEQAYSLVDKGSNQDLQRSLVYAYEYAGQFNKAYELMKEYVKLYPGDSEAAREYEFLKTRTGTSLTPSERAEAEEAAQAKQEDADKDQTASSDAASDGEAKDSSGDKDTSGSKDQTDDMDAQDSAGQSGTDEPASISGTIIEAN